MPASIPPTEHEEIDFLDAVERELVALTTAELEGVESVAITPPAPAHFAHLKAVIPAQAGTHTTQAVNDENGVVATQRGDGSPPSRG